MKLLVTGALGHIGSRLLRGLPELVPGIDVTIVDDLSTQRYPSLFGLPPSGTYRFVEGDVRTSTLESLVADRTAVIHLAAITNATSSFEHPDRIEKNNLEATRAVAQACASAGVPLFFPSTTSVYGTTQPEVDEACPESDIRPQSPYAATKLREEALLRELAATKKLRFVVCRLGTIFGVSPGMRFHTAVNKFCWQAAMGQPVTVWRTAMQQLRPYLELEDAVRAIHFILSKGLFDGRIYNVLSANSTVGDILDVIRERVPKLEVKLVDEKIMNQLSYRVSRARFEAAGFTFRGDLRQGIAQTLDLLGVPGGATKKLSVAV